MYTSLSSSFVPHYHDLESIGERELERAMRHHRRALRALRSGAFDELPDATVEALLTRLASDLARLEREAACRQTSV